MSAKRKQRGTRAAPTAPVAPIFVGPENAIAATGISWRECLQVARAKKVPIVEVGDRLLISARALVAALEHVDELDDVEGVSEQDREATVLARLGRGAASH